MVGNIASLEIIHVLRFVEEKTQSFISLIMHANVIGLAF